MDQLNEWPLCSAYIAINNLAHTHTAINCSEDCRFLLFCRFVCSRWLIKEKKMAINWISIFCASLSFDSLIRRLQIRCWIFLIGRNVVQFFYLIYDKRSISHTLQIHTVSNWEFCYLNLHLHLLPMIERLFYKTQANDDLNLIANGMWYWICN